jgi:integrase/recombinase XerD
MSTPLRLKLIEDMQLHGLSSRTQEVYVVAVRQLADHYGKSPDQISEEELRQYFLYLSQVRKVSPSTFQIALSAIKFFFEYTLQRQWATLELVRPTREKKLPVVLSVEEVSRALACVHRARYRVCLSAIYACGLRLQEGIHLQVGDIDSQRMFIHVHRGKGNRNPSFKPFHNHAGFAPGLDRGVGLDPEISGSYRQTEKPDDGERRQRGWSDCESGAGSRSG